MLGAHRSAGVATVPFVHPSGDRGGGERSADALGCSFAVGEAAACGAMDGWFEGLCALVCIPPSKEGLRRSAERRFSKQAEAELLPASL